MVVVDSSALIPLAWVGRLDLVTDAFDDLRTTEMVREEVLVTGKPGTIALESFLEDVSVEETPPDAERVAEVEGIAAADASVILLADTPNEVLLANDKGLIEVARIHGVECWWVTTLLLKCAKDGDVTSDEATDVLYDLVDEGMNLHPRVYVRVQRRLQEFGD
ncbi:hypothetical protein ACFQPA_09990 [Halomarina halobia]|uniref:DUF3368 domain-containing protein n=1 Tax=Halomarina halobia TaxID=3033386 RepID=A0ABD6ABM2_9EURY|nr:hypothetical protein [Halomarina sp. PSR21]